MKRLGLVVTAALFLAGGAGAVAVPSGLHGVVMRGPVAPMCVAEQPCTQPAKDTTLLFSRHGHGVARAKTDNAGRYHLRLPPGSYGVGLTGTAKVGRGLEPDHARIRTGRYVRLDFSIDTGIR
jgi:hypothetical protein